MIAGMILGELAYRPYLLVGKLQVEKQYDVGKPVIKPDFSSALDLLSFLILTFARNFFVWCKLPAGIVFQWKRK